MRFYLLFAADESWRWVIGFVDHGIGSFGNGQVDLTVDLPFFLVNFFQFKGATILPSGSNFNAGVNALKLAKPPRTRCSRPYGS